MGAREDRGKSSGRQVAYLTVLGQHLVPAPAGVNSRHLRDQGLIVLAILGLVEAELVVKRLLKSRRNTGLSFDSFQTGKYLGIQYGPILSQGVLIFVSAPLVGLTIIVTTLAIAGHMDALFKADFLVTIAFPLAPFLFVGMIAGVASLRGTTIGWCTWLGGFAPILRCSLLAF